MQTHDKLYSKLCSSVRNYSIALQEDEWGSQNAVQATREHRIPLYDEDKQMFMKSRPARFLSKLRPGPRPLKVIPTARAFSQVLCVSDLPETTASAGKDTDWPAGLLLRN